MAERAGRARGAASSGELTARLWFWPVVTSLLTVPVTLLLLRARPAADSALAEWVWATDASAAQGMLQTVATSVITGAGLTFSLTIVALQLTSQQFSPRLLRTFARDGLVQLAMAVLLSAFVVALTTMRGLDPERPLPVLALALAQLLGLAGAVLLVVFVGHLVRRLRVDNMMAAVHEDTTSSIRDAYAPYGEGPEAPSDDLPGPDGGQLLRAWRSGFVRKVEPGPLVEAARAAGVVLLLGARPGDSLIEGAPVGTAFPAGGGDVDLDALREGLRAGVVVGFERTEEQDPAFGLRQLVDIALKAISPGINDPTTAAESLSYCADLLVRLCGRRLGPQVVRDDEGVARVVLPDRDLRYYLDLTVGQVRRFAADMPDVLTALLRLLRDVAVATRDDEQRAEVRRQVGLVREQTSPDLLEEDLAVVRDAAERVHLALAGDLAAAYRDRAGETRSI